MPHATTSIGLYIRVTPAFRARIEAGRLTGYRDRPLEAPGTRDFLVALLDPLLPPSPTPEKRLTRRRP